MPCPVAYLAARPVVLPLSAGACRLYSSADMARSACRRPFTGGQFFKSHL